MLSRLFTVTYQKSDMKKNLICILLLGFIFLPKQKSIAQQNPLFKAYSDTLLANNFNIKIAKNNVAIAKENQGIGMAGGLPSVALIAGQNNTINDTRLEFFNGDIREADNAQNTGFNVGLRLDYQIFGGFQVLARKESLQVQHELANIQMIQQMENELFTLASLFQQWSFLQMRLNQADSAMALSTYRLQLVQQQKLLGKSSSVELLAAQSDYNAEKSNKLIIQSQLNTILIELKALINSADAPLPQNLEMLSLPAITFQDAWEMMQKENKALLAARLQLQLADQNKKIAQSTLLPQLNAFGEYNLNRSQNQVGVLKSNQSLGPAFGLNLQYNLFSGGQQIKAIKNAQRLADNIQTEQEAVENQLKAQLLIAFEQHYLAKNLKNLETENLALSKQNLQMALEQLKLGAILPLQFREVQLQFLEVQTRLNQAQLEEATSRLQISRLCGSLLKELNL